MDLATDDSTFVMDIKISSEPVEVPDGFEEIEELRPDKDVGGVLLRFEDDLNEIKKQEIDMAKLEKQYGKILQEVANQDPHFLDTKEEDGIYEKDIFDYAKELYNKDI